MKLAPLKANAEKAEKSKKSRFVTKAKTSVYEYTTAQPSFQLLMKNFISNKYRIKFASIDRPLSAIPFQKIETRLFQIKLGRSGIYHYQLHNATVRGPAGINYELVQVRAKPLLLAPSLTAKKISGREIRLIWTQVRGALSYQTEITNRKTGRVKKVSSTNTNLVVEISTPGNYGIAVHAIDRWRRAGLYSQSRKINIPNRAPKVTIEVK